MMFHWSHGHNPPYLPVRGVYCLHTELGAHRHDIPCFVHAEHSLHSSWVRNTDSDPVLVMCVPCTSTSAKCFASASLCFKIPIVTCSVCHTHYKFSSVQLSKTPTELLQILPSKYLLCSNNVWCAHWPASEINDVHLHGERVRIQYRTCFALTTHGVRNDQHNGGWNKHVVCE